MTSSYSLPCDCGGQVPVTAAMAGTLQLCQCGRQVQVPGLSQLRRMAGQEAYASSTIEKVNRALNAGELPGECCVSCAVATTEEIHCLVVCEKAFVRIESENDTQSIVNVVAKLLVSPLGLFLSGPGTIEAEIMGHDKQAFPVVKICPACRGMYGNLRRRKNLKKLLSQEPIYLQLLEEYPSAEVRLLKKSERG